MQLFRFIYVDLDKQESLKNGQTYYEIPKEYIGNGNKALI